MAGAGAEADQPAPAIVRRRDSALAAAAVDLRAAVPAAANRARRPLVAAAVAVAGPQAGVAAAGTDRHNMDSVRPVAAVVAAVATGRPVAVVATDRPVAAAGTGLQSTGRR